MEFVVLPYWLWSTLPQLTLVVGTILCSLTNRKLGKTFNKGCICWDTQKEIPKSLVVNIENGFLVMGLTFGTFSSVCFDGNLLGHFARDYPSLFLFAPHDPTKSKDELDTSRSGLGEE